MILKNDSNSPSWLPAVVGGLLFGVLVLLYLFTSHSSNVQAETKTLEGAIVCDAEQTEGEFFKTGEHLFFRGNLQSADFAFSGSYSCKLEETGKRQYGFGYKLKNPVPGMTYKASVWLKNGEAKSVLVAEGPPKSGFYRKEPKGENKEKGWEQLEIIFSIPYKSQFDFIQIYVYSDGKGTAYFDDLTLIPLGLLSADTEDFDLDTIRLTISDKGMKQLQEKRMEAFRNGILESAEDDWIKGHLSSKEGERKKVKLRLKGDWLNHIKGDKWSFRVKLRGGDAWNHLRHFSLHTPEARGFLHEWLLHRLFEHEDVLTTTYDFVLLELNGKPLGVYALEEHFDKVLVESRKRREGVLVKMSESGFWSSVKRQLHYTDRVVHGLAHPEKNMETAEVLPFGENTTLSSPILTNQLEQAQQLLQQYLNGSADVSTVFDIDRMARYFAICDVMGAYHGTVWHNMRFYYNPLSAKLEPIGYDGFEKAGVGYRDSFLGQGALNVNKLKAEKFYFRLFLDKAFVRKYVAYLYDFSKKENLKYVFAQNEAGLYAREQLIQNEFLNYKFDATSWLKDALSVHLMLLPFNDISLKAYTQEKRDGKLKVKVANIHGLPIEILGYGVSESKMVQTLEEPVLLEGYSPRSVLESLRRQEESGVKMDSLTRKILHKTFEEQEPLQQEELTISMQATHLFYKPFGLDTIMHSRISNWPSPYDPVVQESLFVPSKIADNDLYQIDGEVLFFKKGKHQLKEPLIIPKGYRLHFEGGCQIDLQQGAFIWSASPITVRGTEQEPVLIHSTDGKGRGVHLMEAEEESVLRYAHFDGLNTLEVKERRLTGAVTFYESPVTFHHCLFRNNKSEDALNLIRSEFEMHTSIVSQTFADGLDADFCKGKIKDSRFAHTGNDGLDVSGSVILVQDCFFDNNGDKAISIGEDSDASILSATITNAPIAVAVKDLSTLAVSSIKLKDCRQGFVAFQKKAEYGTGKIVVESYEAEGVTKLYNAGADIILKKGS